MGRDRPRSGQGREVAIKLGVSIPAYTSPPVLGCALATLPVSGRGRFQRGQDRFHHPAEIAADLASPDPDDLEAVPPENSVANKVMVGLHIIAVLKAVDFNGQTSREAGEVEVIAAERVLPTEGETSVAEPPQT